MSNVAINDAGDVMVYDGQAWKPAPVAQNAAGDKVVFDGSAWKPHGELMGAAKGRADAARSTSDNLAQAFGQGATMGFGDEMTAAVRAAMPGFSNWMMEPNAWQKAAGQTGQTVSTAPTFQDRYDEELQRERAKAQQFHETNPYLATGANIGGAVASTALTMPASVVRGGGLIANSLRGARTGAILGGVTGFGEGEGGLDNRMGSAAQGASVGAVLGGAAPAVGAGANAVYQRAAPPVLNAVANLAERYAPKVAAMPLSAAAPEGGQIIGDSLATRLADNARIAAGNIEGDAATKRLALELARSGGTRQAEQRLADLGQDAFIADTSKGAERLANVGYILPGEAADKYAAAFNARNQATGTRFAATLPETPPVADALRDYKIAKTQTGSKLYDPVLRGGPGTYNVSPEMKAVMAERPAVREAMAQIKAEAIHNGEVLSEAEIGHLVKQTLNANTEAAFNAGKAVNKNMVAKAGNAWEKALYDANPAIQAADEAYAKVASLSNTKTGEGFLQRGQRFMRAGTSEAATEASPAALARDLPQATPEQLKAFQTGSTSVMRDAAQQGPKSTRRLADKLAEGDYMRQKLDQIYGPAKASEIIKQGNTEKAFAETANNVMRGSPTAQRLASLGDEFALGSSIPTSPLGFMKVLAEQYQKRMAPSQAVRSRLAEMLANPNASANAETLAMVRAMLDRQAAARAYSSGIAGSAAGSVATRP